MLELGKLLQKIFDFHERPVRATDSPETIPGWDSFQSLMLFQELEKASGVSFSVDDLMNIKTVSDLTRLLDKYKIPYSL